jgi:ferritin-like metal-binding protein YciE
MERHDTSYDTAPRDSRSTIATYVSDMLALERHIAAPIEAQISSDEHREHDEARTIFARIKAVTEGHISALEDRLHEVGGDGASAVKSAWSELLGAAAGAINQARGTKVSKSLRDDYAALSLSAISYTMLNAAALGLGDETTAALAKRHLDHLTPIIVDISRTIPLVVLEELRDDGAPVALSAAEYAQRQTATSWSGETTASRS